MLLHSLEADAEVLLCQCRFSYPNPNFPLEPGLVKKESTAATRVDLDFPDLYWLCTQAGQGHPRPWSFWGSLPSLESCCKSAKEKHWLPWEVVIFLYINLSRRMQIYPRICLYIHLFKLLKTKKGCLSEEAQIPTSSLNLSQAVYRVLGSWRVSATRPNS